MAQVPTVHKLQLGRQLRRLRERAGVTREAGAARVRHDYTWLLRAETAKLTPSVAEVELLINFYGVDSDSAEGQRILNIAVEARKRPALRLPEGLAAYIGLESEAIEIRQFAVDLMPGLLQTEEYAHAVFTATDPERDPSETERLVAFRIQRQERVSDAHPLRLSVVLDELAIRRRVGGVEVMRKQLERLLTLSKLPNVSIRVVPIEAGAHAALGVPFSILQLEEEGDRVVYLENLHSAEYLDREMQVQMYSRTFDRLTAAALDVKSTARMIRKVQGELQ